MVFSYIHCTKLHHMPDVMTDKVCNCNNKSPPNVILYKCMCIVHVICICTYSCQSVIEVGGFSEHVVE